MKKFSMLSFNIQESYPKHIVKNIGYLFLITLTAFLFAKGIVSNQIRLSICAFLFLVLGAFCMSIRTGIIAIFIYLPFVAFIRRFIYFFNPYVKLDPIHLLFPILTLFMFSYIFIFHGEEILKQTKKNRLLRYATYFLILSILQIFNPLQGSLMLGMTGVMYWIVPLLWFYFGFFVSRKQMQTIFYIIVVIGVITAIYGLHQIYNGFLPFEEYWIKYGGFSALGIRGFTKAFSTFTNPQEYSHYLMIGMAIVFMYLFKKPVLYPLWTGGIFVLIYGLFMTSTRGTIFMLFVLIGIFLGLRAKNWAKALVANFFFLSIVLLGISKIPTPPAMESVSFTREAHLSHLASGIKHPLAKESTFWARGEMIRGNWRYLKRHWFGGGLGITTLGAMKFGDKSIGGSEEFHLAIAGSFGFPGIILYLLIMFWIIKISIGLVKKDFNTYIVPATLAIWFTFAVDPRLYSTGPFIYLLWGWIAKESVADNQ